MTLKQHLIRMEPDELVEVYRHWAGEIGVPTNDGGLVQRELLRLMSDHDRVLQRYRELPPKCRDFVGWMLTQEDYAVPISRFDEESPDLPVKVFEVDAIAFALRKRGFLLENRDLTWMRYEEPMYLIPGDLGDQLAHALTGEDKSIDSQLSLRAWMRTVSKRDIQTAVDQMDLDDGVVSDRGALVEALCKPERVRAVLDSWPDADEQHMLRRLLADHGGIGEVRHLERMGFRPSNPVEFRRALEETFLGTILSGDFTDVGIQLGRGSLILFMDLVKAWHAIEMEEQPDDEPEIAADTLADLNSIRTFIDHHNVRVTRDGELYRATKRKMIAEVLSPGTRPFDGEESLDWMIRFLEDAALVRSDENSRMRTTRSWDDFDQRTPVQRSELLLTYAENDLRDARGAFHLSRLRRIFLSVLKEAGPSRWLRLRTLATLARNRYLLNMDRPALSERFQQRYKYAQVPPLTNPSALINELVRFGGAALSMAGLTEVLGDDDGPEFVRLTRMGAAVLGFKVEMPGDPDDGALIITADFEVVLFPDAGGMDLVHEVSRFSKREKADYSLHYRITERSIQQAIAGGMAAPEIVDVLRKNGRHEPPQNVIASIHAWANDVQVLQARRVLLVTAPSKEALDAVLKVRELRSVVGERLNDVTLELTADPSTPRIAEALRSQGFFLR